MTTPWQKLGYKPKLGLRPRSESLWLPRNDLFEDETQYEEQIQKKSYLFKYNHSDIFATLPVAKPASIELLEMILEHINRYHHISSPEINFAQHPLEAAARLVPEDLLLLAPRLNRLGEPKNIVWHLVAGAVAFPAHWQLKKKMNLPLGSIHEPVPHYDEKLATPVDRFLTTMRVGPISSRQNWSVQIEDELFTPKRVARSASNAANSLSSLFLRIENQTLRKLPKSGYVAFTIRTHLLSMRKWQNDKDALKSMLNMMEKMSLATQNYKGVKLYKPILTRAIKNMD